MNIQVPDLKTIQAKPVVVPTGQAPVGFTASAARPGEGVWLELCGFHTFDEGLQFYHMLEGFNKYVRHCGLTESTVDRMLVCISKKETLIYVNNDLPMVAMMRVKRSITAGEGVSKDDIASIDRLDFPSVKAPEGSGFLLLISAGWRRGMCFDLCPLSPDSEADSTEAFDHIKRMGGMVFTHLHYTEKFLLSDEDWHKVLDAGWFPFIFLPSDLWQSLITSIRNSWELSADEQKIHEKWLEKCDERLDGWKANKYFADHIDFLDRAVRAYKEGEWLTVVSVATPRVEGLMRLAFGAWGTEREVIDKLAENVQQQEHCRSLLFPDRLKQYFESVFYQFVRFSKPDLPNSRHTLLHGLVKSNKLTRKEALTLLLLIDHILYCMPLDAGAKPPSPF